jgi:hypothetical protein
MERFENRAAVLLIFAALLVAGCSKNEPAQVSQPMQQGVSVPGQPAPQQQPVQQPAAQPATATPATQPTATPGAVPTPTPTGAQPGNPMAGLMGALGAMQGQQQPGAASTQAIHWQSLTQALPVSAPGWTLKGQPKGESANVMGISVAQASCELTQGNMTADVQIVDTSMNPMLAMPFNMARSVQVDSSEERMGPINFGNYPGTQRFDKRSKKAEVIVMVKNRVMITVKVRNAAAEASAVSVMQYVNFNHLSSLLGG